MKMGNRYLVVSDLHLTDVEDHPDGWKFYKSSELLSDEAFGSLVEQFVSEAPPGDRLTLVLNGDTFDFDLVSAVPDQPPWPVSGFERRRGLHPTAEKSRWKLERVLSHHPEFMATLARFVARGHHLVCLRGNHDAELHFAEVRQAFVAQLEKSAQEQQMSLVAGSVRFEPWFFYVPGEIYAEHGHQYDFYTSFKYPLWPTVTVEDEERIAIPMGDLSNRYLLSRMGYFNPHASDYILNVFSYAAHWLRHYAFSRRSLALNWLWGSLLVVALLFRSKRKLRAVPPQHEVELERLSHVYDLPLAELRALGQLHPKPITSRLFRLLRELWIDRLIIALLMTGSTITLALVPIPLWIKLMVPLTAFPLLYLIYEQLAQGETIFTLEQEIPEHARAVARVLPARVLTFGHSHVPRLIPLSRKRTFVDTGTWAPVMSKKDRRLPCPGLRNYLLLSFHRGEAAIELGSWTGEGTTPRVDDRAELRQAS